MGCKRYDGCIICVLFQISWQLQTQNFKNRTLSDSLLGNKLILGNTGDILGNTSAKTRHLNFNRK